MSFCVTVARPIACSAQRPRWIPDSVELNSDVFYADTDNPRQTLDLAAPRRELEDPLPVVAYVHGGAWRAGDKRNGLRQVMRFVESGRYAAASIGYRLSGEAKWPAQIHDCKAAIRWIRAHADEYGLDADRIGVWGSSAGGHLVAMLGASGDVEAMDGSLGPHADGSSRVACVVDFFGPTDFLQMNRAAVE
ncbi:MAG: alpha/beta hydrolase, partial [Planctomycetota bacterium]